MKKTYCIIIVIIFACKMANAQVKPEDNIKGTWLTENKDGKVELLKSGNTWIGKLVWGKYVLDANGKPKLDVMNPDPKLRSRQLQDLVFITGLVYNDGKWQDGKIYDSTTGKTYNVVITIKGNNMSLRGYIGIPLLGKTTVWQRINRE